MQGKIKQLRGKIKETWGRLSDDDIVLANGKMDQFLGKVQQTYGLTKEAAQKRYNEIAKSMGLNSDTCGFDSEKSKSCGFRPGKAA
jgi:uncharacterized protein YjbJ (UPF0337 family)